MKRNTIIGMAPTKIEPGQQELSNKKQATRSDKKHRSYITDDQITTRPTKGSHSHKFSSSSKNYLNTSYSYSTVQHFLNNILIDQLLAKQIYHIEMNKIASQTIDHCDDLIRKENLQINPSGPQQDHNRQAKIVIDQEPISNVAEPLIGPEAINKEIQQRQLLLNQSRISLLNQSEVQSNSSISGGMNRKRSNKSKQRSSFASKDDQLIKIRNDNPKDQNSLSSIAISHRDIEGKKGKKRSRKVSNISISQQKQSHQQRPRFLPLISQRTQVLQPSIKAQISTSQNKLHNSRSNLMSSTTSKRDIEDVLREMKISMESKDQHGSKIKKQNALKGKLREGRQSKENQTKIQKTVRMKTDSFSFEESSQSNTANNLLSLKKSQKNPLKTIKQILTTREMMNSSARAGQFPNSKNQKNLSETQRNRGIPPSTSRQIPSQNFNFDYDGQGIVVKKTSGMIRKQDDRVKATYEIVDNAPEPNNKRNKIQSHKLPKIKKITIADKGNKGTKEMSARNSIKVNGLDQKDLKNNLQCQLLSKRVIFKELKQNFDDQSPIDQTKKSQERARNFLEKYESSDIALQ